MSWFRRRGIERVVHFHCDHFEPGRKDGSGEVIGWDHACRWMDAIEDMDVRPSIFYKSMWLAKKSPEQANRCHDKGLPTWMLDGQHFAEHSMARADEGILVELAQRGFDIHPHIHHEHWCSGQNMPKEEWDSERDGRRLEGMIKLLLGRYTDLGVMEPEGWGFVHGAWALNASDPDICQIENEMEILHFNGCVADFSFPSGRPWCDPVIKAPFTVSPYQHGPAVYNTNQCEPQIVGAVPMERWRRPSFLIWSQWVEHDSCSMDRVRNLALDDGRLDSHTRAFVDFANRGWVYEGTLFVKTHAHSLWYEHWDSATSQTSSLLSGPVRGFFQKLQAHCDEDGIPLEYWTVREVIDHLKEMDRA